MARRRAATPRRVDWSRADDFDVAFLGELGFSTRMIRERTGPTDCQIGYRLRKADVRRMDYRNGGSDMARHMLRLASPERPAVRARLTRRPEGGR